MTHPTRGAFVIPALDAESTLPAVLRGLGVAWREAAGGEPLPPVLVVDDGSRDETARVAKDAGAEVVSHGVNRGKGAALQTAWAWGLERGLDFLVSLDADGQHLPEEAVRLFLLPEPATSLILGVRDLARAGAPRPNQLSNRFSNQVLSLFGGKRLEDTQCGLRRYPIRESLALGAKDPGFAFEADVVLRAARRGMPIAHVPVECFYPPGDARVTHFDSVKDPARIVRRVVWTTLTVPHHRAARRWGRRLLFAALLFAAVALSAHLFVRCRGRIEPPALDVTAFEPLSRQDERGVRRFGRSEAFRRDGIWEVHLRGSPEEIGFSHSRLLYDEMIENEGVLFDAFESAVPSFFLRGLVLDLAVWGYRNVARGMDPARTRELGAQARAFSPDPYERFFPTFQRFVYLSSLYDISLSFEYSPLIGCTTFTVDEGRSKSGGALLARAFDFEVDEIFDRKKAVFFVREDGLIPFASVAWPGLVGVVSGVNTEGVGVVVHGARAGETTTVGEPVVHALRRVLQTARTTDEAVRALSERSPLVSHLIIVTDARGDARAIERIPGLPQHVRKLEPVSAVTNHLEGPFQGDPKNQRVRQSTSTLPRRARGDALITQHEGAIGISDLVDWLRDDKDVDGTPLEEGDRRAIDAHIATHGVVIDATHHEIWVSQSPHLSGAFSRYSLDEVFADDHRIDPARERRAIPAAAPR